MPPSSSFLSKNDTFLSYTLLSPLLIARSVLSICTSSLDVRSSASSSSLSSESDESDVPPPPSRRCFVSSSARLRTSYSRANLHGSLHPSQDLHVHCPPLGVLAPDATLAILVLPRKFVDDTQPVVPPHAEFVASSRPPIRDIMVA